jgi:hypothetical protein
MINKTKLNKAVVDLVNQMFVIAGHNVTYEDVVGVDNWFQKYTMTIEQGEELKEWGERYLIKNIKMSRKKAESEMSWFVLQYGLKYSNFYK